MTESDPILCSPPPLLDHPLCSPLWIISEQQSPFYGYLLLEIFSFPFLSSESFKEWFVYFFFSHPVPVRTRKWGWILFQNLLLLGNHPLAPIGVAEKEKKQSHGEPSFEKVQTAIPKKLP